MPPVRRHALALAALALTLAGCGSLPKRAATTPAPPARKTPARVNPGVPVLPAAGSGRGGYYKDDGPGENPPPGLLDVPDAEVKFDPPLPRANKSYVVFGKTYTPITGDQPFTQRGVGSWYGKKFHGQRTSSGEIYDMYKMTAAHPTLPIPSYARVTDIASGKQVIVRINDRGPFHANRVIDVSYTAALKLGLLSKGSHELQIDRLLPADIERMKTARRAAPVAVAQVVMSQPVPMDAPPAAAKPTPNWPANATAPVTGEVTQPETTQPVLPPVAAAEQGAPAGAARPGIYLQLGAFSRADNAEAMRARLASNGALGALDVVYGAGVHRLFGGPFASRAEATRAAQSLPWALKRKAIVVQR
ncbi:MAG TPA: septal ring lytic transglycosylase RlpA family protein [Janthinobacterium sp.]|nr:septal ring lytic transglycosylase RlpA family protein [Janthinobacterium sp.]